MMAFQTVFKRYELKYLLTAAQKDRILDAMQPHMSLDRYGRTTIRNLYMDTDSYRLIRHSIEKPAYKEKLRIRSYRRAAPENSVFVELKKTYDHVVYKRRIAMPEAQAMDWVLGRARCPQKNQISDEIDYFLSYYQTLRPAAFLSYDREAYDSLAGDDFRVTFDDSILCRQELLSLESDVWGAPVLEPGSILMEIKCPAAIPLWMVRVLSDEHIYRTSFSKYGTAYRTLIFPKLKEEIQYA